MDKYPEAVSREFGKSVQELRWGRRVRDPNAMDLIRVEDVVEKLDLAFAERGIVPGAGDVRGVHEGAADGAADKGRRQGPQIDETQS